MMTKELHEQLFQRLKEHADSRLSVFASALIPNLSRPMLGVKLPVLRTMARELAMSDWKKALRDGLTYATFEEIMLRGLVLGYAPIPFELRWREIRQFVPLIDNWSVCDSCCATYKDVRTNRAAVWQDLLSDLYSIHEFQQRFAIVMMMDHFMTDDFIDSVLDAWSHVDSHGYYVEMAIGWGLSVAFIKYPEKTLPLLTAEKLPLACRKKACQKILESRRTPQHWRPVIQKMRTQLAVSK